MLQDATTTVMGVFDDYKTAERVTRDLADAGIPREAIDVRSNFRTGAAGRTTEQEESHEGGIAGFFHRLFGGDREHEDYGGHYAEAVRRGNAVVAVTTTEDNIERIVEVMNSAGAVDIDRHVENYRRSGNYERYDPDAPAYTSQEAARERERFRSPEQNASIPVVEEQLEVGKRAVQRGGVRVYSHVVEEPVEENVQLREEKVRVERRPADRPVAPGDRELRDQSIEVTEMSEEPVVQKRARVREEVVVGKEATERTETVRDNVRRTEVEVEPLNTGGDYRSDFRRDWQQRYANSGDSYEIYEPAYEYGYRSASDPRYKGRSWTGVEQDLRNDYVRMHPNSTWERMKDAVRYGWDKVTQRR
jgi:uncharacterized protein (TIGR02271 family)